MKNHQFTGQRAKPKDGMTEHQTKNFGFTLIEMMIVIVIVSILAIVVIPLFNIPNNKLKGEARNIYANLQKAKSEAIRQNSNVAVLFTTGAYTPEGGVGSYVVFIDNGDGGGTENNSVRDGSEPIISSGSTPKGISLITSGYTFTGVPGFNGQGLPLKWGSVQLRNSIRWYKITVSSAGYIKLEISKDGTTWSL